MNLSDKKIRKIIEITESFNKIDNKLFEFLNERIYEKMVGPVVMKIEDLLFLSLFDEDYIEIHEGFATPGMTDNEKDNKVILWDHKNGGYPPEKLSDLFKNQNNLKKEDLFKKIKTQIKLIKKAQKKRKRKS